MLQLWMWVLMEHHCRLHNTKPLIAELLIMKGKIKIIRRKQDLSNLINY